MADTVAYECRDCNTPVSEPLSNFTDHPNSWVYTDFRCEACSERTRPRPASAEAVREEWGSLKLDAIRMVSEIRHYAQVIIEGRFEPVNGEAIRQRCDNLIDLLKVMDEIVPNAALAGDRAGEVDDLYKARLLHQRGFSPTDACSNAVCSACRGGERCSCSCHLDAAHGGPDARPEGQG